MSKELKIQAVKEKPLLLFSCLDWGLGHTTRSVPLIRELLALDCRMIVACNSSQKSLLQLEFPSLSFVDIPGYDILYGNANWSTKVEIVFQIRKILTRIKVENAWLRSFLKGNAVNGLISDNRYGFYHSSVPSILITHQLALRTGYGGLADRISQRFLYRLISKFTECWVPDVRDNSGLAGALSHPAVSLTMPTQYLGIVSRFDECSTVASESKKLKLLAIISGPEPQRTLFETLIVEQLKHTDISSAIVRGLPGEQLNNLNVSPNVEVHNHLDSKSLKDLICSADFVLCRSGYTSMMDLMTLKKKVIVVPTPGQPEQEYLAGWLSQQRYVVAMPQKTFSLSQALQLAEHYSFATFQSNKSEYKEVLKNFVGKISSLSPSSKS